jgi:hypothetical protein
MNILISLTGFEDIYRLIVANPAGDSGHKQLYGGGFCGDLRHDIRSIWRA